MVRFHHAAVARSQAALSKRHNISFDKTLWKYVKRNNAEIDLGEFSPPLCIHLRLEISESISSFKNVVTLFGIFGKCVILNVPVINFETIPHAYITKIFRIYKIPQPVAVS